MVNLIVFKIILRREPHRKQLSSIDACVFFTAGTCLPSRCSETAICLFAYCLTSAVLVVCFEVFAKQRVCMPQYFHTSYVWVILPPPFSLFLSPVSIQIQSSYGASHSLNVSSLPQWLHLLSLSLTVSGPVYLGINHPSGAYDQIFITVGQLRVCWCGALSDERTGLSFTIVTGPRQRNHSRVRVPWNSRPYFTVSDSRLSFSLPPTTRRATVEVFEPASTRHLHLLIYLWRLKQLPGPYHPERVWSGIPFEYNISPVIVLRSPFCLSDPFLWLILWENRLTLPVGWSHGSWRTLHHLATFVVAAGALGYRSGHRLLVPTANHPNSHA
jgi:hypothetical protein